MLPINDIIGLAPTVAGVCDGIVIVAVSSSKAPTLFVLSILTLVNEFPLFGWKRIVQIYYTRTCCRSHWHSGGIVDIYKINQWCRVKVTSMICCAMCPFYVCVCPITNCGRKCKCKHFKNKPATILKSMRLVARIAKSKMTSKITQTVPFETEL